jgi:hypothetical protein
VFDLLFLIAQRELAVGRSLALEGNFVRGQAERQFSVLPSHHQLQVHCSAPEKVLIARYRSRERHPGHLDESITKEIVAAIRDGRHRPLDIGGELVEIDTSEPFDLDAVEKRLGGSY